MRSIAREIDFGLAAPRLRRCPTLRHWAVQDCIAT